MNLLEQLKTLSKVVADSGDFESTKKFKPQDSTTNPSLIYTAALDPEYATLVDDANAFAKSKSTTVKGRISLAIDKLLSISE